MKIDRENLKRLDLSSTETLRPVNLGAEEWMGAVIPVLDHGFVYLVDYQGTDQSIEQAARVSYGEGTRQTSETKGLLRYLMRNEHTSPFEMADIKFHAKMPIFVARQWVRHRTASLNEYSARYSVVKDEFYIPNPSEISIQSKDNKQGRGEIVSLEKSDEITVKLNDFYRGANDLYQILLSEDKGGFGIARELARTVLPVASYTEWYWKTNLHNMLHFLKLRMNPHAQYEIREYANAMAEVIKDAFPITWEAFDDYQLNATKITRPEKEVIIDMLRKRRIVFSAEEIKYTAEQNGLNNKRETEELIDKIKKFGLLE
jgi:thymidylate synthase (FAD)